MVSTIGHPNVCMAHQILFQEVCTAPQLQSFRAMLADPESGLSFM